MVGTGGSPPEMAHAQAEWRTLGVNAIDVGWGVGRGTTIRGRTGSGSGGMRIGVVKWWSGGPGGGVERGHTRTRRRLLHDGMVLLAADEGKGCAVADDLVLVFPRDGDKHERGDEHEDGKEVEVEVEAGGAGVVEVLKPRRGRRDGGHEEGGEVAAERRREERQRAAA